MYILVTSTLLALSINANSVSLEMTSYNAFNTYCIINLDEDIQFYLYTREPQDKSCTLNVDNISLLNNYINHNNKTIIFIHGFGETALDITPQAIANAYLSHSEYNVILVDWSKLAAGPWYSRAVNNVEKVGLSLATFVKLLLNIKIIDMPKLHVIEYSLGAHVAGFMGKRLAPQKIGRITGLDPAGPSFESVLNTKRLYKTDAAFVDVIHTNFKICGLREPIGHADFYPNYGAIQPGCKFYDIKCSHNRARNYYIESIKKPFGFPARRCREWSPIVKKCLQYPDAYMGFHLDPDTRGIFLLRTNSESPFARYMNDYRHTGIKETEC